MLGVLKLIYVSAPSIWTAVAFWISSLALNVIATALIATAKAFRNHGAGIANDDHEDAPRPSRVFAPAGLIPTPAEKELLAEWSKLPAELRYERPGHH